MKYDSLLLTLIMYGKDSILDLLDEIKHQVKMTYVDFFLLF